MDLQGSTLLQSHTPCVALGKHLSTSANREWQLNAPWYAVSLGDNRPMRVGKCVDKTVVKVGLSRIPTGGMVCRIQDSACCSAKKRGFICVFGNHPHVSNFLISSVMLKNRNALRELSEK